MSTTLTSLPTEILLQSINILTPDPDLPVIGYNAAWLNPISFDIHQMRPKSLIPTHSRVFVDEKGPSLTDIANLQQTCRQLYTLCTPIIRHDLNLLDETASHDRFALEQASNYWRHIGTIRFLLDHRSTSKGYDNHNHTHVKIITDILTLCTNATSVGIYYHRSDPSSILSRETSDLGGRLFDIITGKGRSPLKSLGIYCIPLMLSSDYADPIPNTTIMPFLDRIISCPDALQSLQHFDIVERLLPRSPFPTLPQLNSLTLYRSWSNPTHDIWTIKQLCSWIMGSKLIRLQLINCAFDPSAILECVQICPSLQHLMVSGCGEISEGTSPSRSPGWSKRPEALCMRRKPLQSLFIEHMDRCGISALGVIPTLHVAFTSSIAEEIEEVFKQDNEVFPHLQKLSVEEWMRVERDSGDVCSYFYMESLDRLSDERNFFIDYDACWRVNEIE
ncbi:hypothetical protein CPB86DRAFT_778980 [Serendipita vermifera]|nr:hypothetical protein CPB86DRAFT_778980 [Serendipita vermifera]